MRKKTIVNVFHYAVKYLLIALPVILILISPFVLNEDFKGSSEFEYTYKYQTNVVNTVDDLVVGNAYHYDFSNVSSFAGSLDGFMISDNVPFSVSTDYFGSKSWNGLTSFNGAYVWTDGNNIYYSSSANQYVLDKDTSTWSVKTWNGLTSFNGNSVWTDGNDIYYSSSANQYVLDKDTSTWSVKTWNGLTSFVGTNVWTDGNNIYYSSSANQYVLDKDTSTWSAIYFSPIFTLTGSNVWTDGINTYYSTTTTSIPDYVFDSSLKDWSVVSFTGLSNFNGSYVWTDGVNTYYSYNADQYIFDSSTLSWTSKVWGGYSTFIGSKVWNDGDNIYYSDNANQYVLSLGFTLDDFSSVGNFIYQSHSDNFTDVSFISSLSDEDNVVVGYQYADGGLFDDICKFFNRFVNLPINSWYKDFLNLIGVGSMVTNTALGLMFYMPLWIVYIFIFDLFLDALLMLPKTAHHWMEKIGGDYE